MHLCKFFNCCLCVNHKRMVSEEGQIKAILQASMLCYRQTQIDMTWNWNFGLSMDVVWYRLLGYRMFSFDTHTLYTLKSGTVIYTFFLNSLRAVPACLSFLTSSGATPILRGLHPQRHIKAAVTATSFQSIELRFVPTSKIHTHWTGAKLWRHKVCRPLLARASAIYLYPLHWLRTTATTAPPSNWMEESHPSRGWFTAYANDRSLSPEYILLHGAWPMHLK